MRILVMLLVGIHTDTTNRLLILFLLFYMENNLNIYLMMCTQMWKGLYSRKWNILFPRGFLITAVLS